MIKLYPYNSASLMLGCLLKQPSILLTGRYNLKGKMFEDCMFHRIIFFTVRQLLDRGVSNIDSVAFDTFIQSYPEYLEVCKDNNYLEVINEIQDISDLGSFDYYYDEFSKYALLRFYKEHGFDIKEFFDETQDEAVQQENLNQFTRDQIVSYFDKINIDAKKQFVGDSDIETLKIGDGFEEIKKEFMKTPMFGGTTFSKMLNTATRGLVKGQLTVHSLQSGSGKSTMGIANLVKLCCPIIWDYDMGDYVKNPNYQGEAGLYIEYEMDLKYEVQPRFFSAISGVPTHNILNGTYQEGESERVDKAIDIFKESNIHAIMMPTFTLASIENTVQEYVLTKHIGYLVFDYISEQASVNSEVSKNNNVTTRGDMVLVAMCAKLKDIAVRYNIAVQTYTQTNGKEDLQDIVDASCISGARAIQNKADVAAVILPLRPREKQIAEDYVDTIHNKGFSEKLKPNRIIHLYKVRFGNEEQGIKIWGNIDLSTGKWTDLWCTTKFNEPYKIKSTELKGKI